MGSRLQARSLSATLWTVPSTPRFLWYSSTKICFTFTSFRIYNLGSLLSQVIIFTPLGQTRRQDAAHRPNSPVAHFVNPYWNTATLLCYQWLLSHYNWPLHWSLVHTGNTNFLCSSSASSWAPSPHILFQSAIPHIPTPCTYTYTLI